MLVAAGIILAAAVIWLIILESNSYTRAVCKSINAFGYHCAPSDFYLKGYGADVSISELVEQDLSEPVELSKKCGYEADVLSKGVVELMLWNMGEDRIMCVWLVDRQPQLVYIENTKTNELSAIDAK